MPTLNAHGYLVLDLPDGALHIPIEHVRFTSGVMLVTGARNLEPGETCTIPAGRWPVTLLGDDGRPVFRSASTFDRDHTATRDEGSTPVFLSVILPVDMAARHQQ